MKLPKLILASGSPRRAEILTSVGWEFTKHVPDIDESERHVEVDIRGERRADQDQITSCTHGRAHIDSPARRRTRYAKVGQDGQQIDAAEVPCGVTRHGR